MGHRCRFPPGAGAGRAWLEDRAGAIVPIGVKAQVAAMIRMG
jgi:hypothetical protein